MRPEPLRLTVGAALLLAVATAPASAQYQPPFPSPAIEPPASQSSVMNLHNRIVALEQQIAQFLRQSEENAFRVSQIETEINRLRQENSRLQQLEQRLSSLPAGGQVAAAETPAPRPAQSPLQSVANAASQPSGSDALDPAEEAYDAGYQLWRDGKYDQAITALRAMASSFPKHRRVSWANNLAGRAMLDKGEPRAAAEALLANYRSNPKGERAADSLFYLGQSLMKLGQPSQACKAYAELEAVYGSSMRAELQRLLPGAKSEAKCG